MVIANVSQDISNILTYFLGTLSLTEARLVLEPLIIFIIGMVIYSIFVFKFYRFIARRDIFRLSKGGETSALKRLGYALEYIFLFPIIAFFWFLVISFLLSMLSQVPILKIPNIFMASMAILATIRVSAYYNEDLSRDIAKLIPFALLAILLLDISDLSITVIIQVLQQIPLVASTVIYYFIFIVLLEFILRIAIHGKDRNKKIKESQLTQ